MTTAFASLDARMAVRLTVRVPAWVLGLGLLLTSAPALGASLPAQGALRTASGGPAADGNYVFIVRLYEAKDAPAEVFEETIAPVAVSGGWFGIALGAGKKPIPDALLTSGKDLWLGVQVGGDPELERTPLGWVARAWHAQQAADLACSGCIEAAELADGAVTSAKVAFAYAGADSKGGAAKLAESAKFADAAKAADFATVAAKAGSADEAGGLQCTGCVALGHLHPDVAKAFVGTTGGKVDGKLEVAGELALGGSTISGGRFAAVDVAKATCTASQLGQVVVDTATKRLHFCDGAKFLRLSACAGECKKAADIACGQPIPDDCGELVGCTGQGTACPAGKTCTGGACAGDPGSQDEPVLTCNELKKKAAGKPSGTYWLDPDGPSGPLPPVQAFCDQDTSGGGWTRIDYKADLPFQSWFGDSGDAPKWLPADFQTVLSKAHVLAIQGHSSEGKQTYVGQCEDVLHYFYPADSSYTYAFGFRFLDGTTTPAGKQSYAPFAITVLQDGCKTNDSAGADPAKGTWFAISSKLVPVVNVQSHDSGGSTEKFGSPLTKNPAWLR